MPDIDQLTTFVTAVDCGSFSAAARKLGKAQSAVSATISNLEIDLDLTLFDRTGYRPVPTEEGLNLLSYARTVLDSMGTFNAQVEAFSGSMEPSFAFYVQDGLMVERVVALCAQLADNFPQLELTIERVTKTTALNALRSGEADAAFVVQADPSDQSYHSRGIGFQRAVPVCHVDHPLTKLPSRSLMDLSRHRQIVGPEVKERSPSARHFSPNVWISSCLTTRKTMVLNGLGWAELPVDTVRDEVLGGALKVLDYDFAQNSILYPVDFLTSNASVDGPVIRWLIDQIGAWDQRAWVGDRNVH